MTHAELLAAMQALLGPDFDLQLAQNAQGDVTFTFDRDVVTGPIVAIPDVHLGDGGAGDIFYAGLGGTGEKLARLLALFSAVHSLLDAGQGARAVQLGDWFDVWRTAGSDVKSMQYGGIQNALVYQPLLDLDAQIGLAHLVGNHDASFLDAVPDRRAAQSDRFRLGFWLGSNVYALHGHQSDLDPPQNATEDEIAVAVASTLAQFVPGVTTFEAYLDRFGTGSGIWNFMLDLRHLRDDPGPQPRNPLAAPPGMTGPFVDRECNERLTAIVEKVSAASNRDTELLIVGHSHNPCISWAPKSDGRPLLIVDAGGWPYDQTNVLLAAGDTVAVYDVVRL